MVRRRRTSRRAGGDVEYELENGTPGKGILGSRDPATLVLTLGAEQDGSWCDAQRRTKVGLKRALNSAIPACGSGPGLRRNSASREAKITVAGSRAISGVLAHEATPQPQANVDVGCDTSCFGSGRKSGQIKALVHKRNDL